jgi:hypothetical protein
MTIHPTCDCGTALEIDGDRPVTSGLCPTCGRPFMSSSRAKRRRPWIWFVFPCLAALGFAGVLFRAIENAREVAARAH